MRYWAVWLALTVLVQVHMSALAKDNPPPEVYRYYERNNDRGIWDGNWTTGVSGLGQDIPDPGSSEGEAGPDTVDRQFFIPSPMQYPVNSEDIERDELFGIERNPKDALEANVLLPMPMVLDGETLPAGYYQVILSDHYAGSQRHNLGWRDSSLPPGIANARNKKGQPGQLTSMVLKRQGRVVAVVPIDRADRYMLEKGQADPGKYGAAVVVMENDKPVLRFYRKGLAYSSNLGNLIALEQAKKAEQLAKAKAAETARRKAAGLDDDTDMVDCDEFGNPLPGAQPRATSSGSPLSVPPNDPSAPKGAIQWRPNQTANDYALNDLATPKAPFGQQPRASERLPSKTRAPEMLMDQPAESHRAIPQATPSQQTSSDVQLPPPDWSLTPSGETSAASTSSTNPLAPMLNLLP